MMESQSTITSELEYFLLRTFPRSGLKGNLRVRVRKVKSNLQGLELGDFPAACLLPIDIHLAGITADRFRTDVTMLGFVQNSLSLHKYYSDQQKACLDHGRLLANLWSYDVGFRWRATWSHETLLEKRTTTETELPRQHQVWFSRFGVEIPLEQSTTLDRAMNEHLSLQRWLPSIVRDREFEIIYDEVTHIWTLKILCNRTQPETQYVVTRGEPMLTHSNPFLEVHFEMSKFLHTQNHRDGFEFVRIMSAIINCVWDSLHSLSAGWMAPVTQPGSKERFLPILKLKRWAKAVHHFFYLPLVQTLCPELVKVAAWLDVNMDRLPAKLPTILKKGLEFFEQVKHMDDTIATLVMQTDQNRLREDWQQLGSKFAKGFDFRMTQIVSYKPLWRVLSQKFLLQLSGFEKANPGVPVKRYNPIQAPDIPEFELRHLSRTLDNLIHFYATLRDREKLINKPTYPCFIRSLVGDNFLQNHSQKGLFDDSYAEDKSKVTFAEMYRDIVVVMLEEKRDHSKHFKFCILHKDGKIEKISFEQYGLVIPEQLIWAKKALFWDEGKLVIIQTFWGSVPRLFCIDFQKCVGPSPEAPSCIAKDLPGFEELFEADKHKTLSTFMKDTLYYGINKPQSKMPKLYWVTLTEQGIKNPILLDWKLTLPQKQLARLARFGSEKAHLKPFATLTSSAKSQRVFVTFLQPVKAPKKPSISSYELTIVVLKQVHVAGESVLRRYQNKTFSIDTEFLPITPSSPSQPFSDFAPYNAKIVNQGKYEFLFLQSQRGLSLAFGIQEQAIKWFTINGRWAAMLPKMLGTELCPLGRTTDLLSRYSYTWDSFMATEKRSLTVHYLQIAY